MGDDGIPEHVKQFLYEHISSAVQLELLLFLCNRSHEEWTASRLVKEFRVDREWLDAQLAELSEHGLLQVTKEGAERTYRYSPSTPELEKGVFGLGKAYTDRRVTVTNLIYSKPVDNIRVFADAFRFRKG